MERGSDKHGARRDDALAHEVDGTTGADGPTGVSSGSTPEPSGEDQPDVHLRPDGLCTAGARGDDRSGRGAAQRGGASPSHPRGDQLSGVAVRTASRVRVVLLPPARRVSLIGSGSASPPSAGAGG